MIAFKDEADFQVHWLPFQLNPQAPGGKGVNKMDVYCEKLGGGWKTWLIRPFFFFAGLREGISFSMGGNTGNTFDSHRLISLAAKQGLQDQIVEELFQNYFEQEKCISDHEVLLAAAQKVGLTGAAELLESDAESAEVNADLQKYQRNRGIHSVPHFLIQDRHTISGAYGSGAFKQLFSDIVNGKA
eukprot:TRINITY_DN35877_c0_g1_i1.p1 TRINITY_DN35877_c0_g1~~TRINITY_DN35877_c0_g1_i1.p1  ORF type:complete len:186 (-),score=32.70 TRINITY_DN35877_c0_g1_i1:263-820(-)